jgi:UDPglucose 6-dehydrogenase
MRNKMKSTNNLTIGFIGLGKLGLPVALAIETKGHNVIGYDINPDVAGYIRDKKIPYSEICADDLLPKSNIKFTEVENIVKNSDIIFVPVQTPHDPLYEGCTRLPESRVDFNYDALVAAMKNLSAEVEKNGEEKIVVIISTVLPGTIEKYIKPILSNKIKLCYNPFFIAMGTTIKDFLHPEFVLFGVDDPEAAKFVESFYATLHNKKVFKTSIKNAELIKVAYNTFIGMKIVYANTMMEICHKIGADVDSVIDAICLADERLISPKYLRGGMGDGGGCHPRDNIAMSWLSKTLNLSHDYFQDLMIAREDQTEWLANLCITENRKVCILGKSFKPETNIQTGSPAILLANILKEKGIQVTQIDPHTDGEKAFNEVFGSVDNNTLFFLGTQHDYFKTLNYPKGSVVIDPFRYMPNIDGVKIIKIGGENARNI